ncbi:DsrE family protein [Flavobacterium ovatum]|uniref:DsrE family protein n=1 Tax=Flavobacterium ovatum TaxID=1928857 RepID=UPI003450EEFE
MKNLFTYIVLICFLIAGTTQIKAQNFNPKKNNYLVLSQNIQQLEPILLTAEALAQEDGKKYGDFYVIICGKTVNDLINNSSLNELLKHAKEKNVTIYACGISLKKFNITPDQLPDNLTVVENGILYGLQLNKKGFITISI